MYAEGRYNTFLPVLIPIELNLAGSPADQHTLTMPFGFDIRYAKFLCTTSLNSSVDPVIAFKNSTPAEVATFTIPKATAAKADANSTDYGHRINTFANGICTINLKTAATSAGKGYLMLLLREIPASS